jgi:hypothetical protein
MAKTTKEFDIDESISSIRTEMHRRFTVAFDQAGAKFDPESMVKDITAMLMQERREIVLKLIGFRDSCGRMEVDTHRERGSQNIVKDYINEFALKAVNDWLDKEFLGALTAKAKERMASPAVKKAMEQEFIRVFEYRMSDLLRKQAEELADQTVRDFSDQIMAKMSLTKSEE